MEIFVLKNLFDTGKIWIYRTKHKNFYDDFVSFYFLGSLACSRKNCLRIVTKMNLDSKSKQYIAFAAEWQNELCITTLMQIE